MPIQVIWDDDAHTRIRYDFTGEWNWTDYRAAVQEAYDLMRSVSHQVDTIANFKASPRLPGGALQQVKRALDEAPDNVGELYIAHGSPFVNTITATFGRVYTLLGQRVFVAKTLDDARAMSETRRAG